MTINENNRNKRNIVKNRACKFIYISAAYYPKLAAALDLLALVCDV